MKKIIAAALALAAFGATLGVTAAEARHHRHRVCTWHHHHKVCHWR